jgi:hypothetical protein
MYLQKGISIKTKRKKNFGVLKVTEEESRIRIRIQITKNLDPDSDFDAQVVSFCYYVKWS